MSPQKEHIFSYHITDEADIHKDFLGVSCIAGRFVTIWATRETHFIYLKSAIWEWSKGFTSLQSEVKWKLLSCVQLFETPWAPCTVHGTLQARILEWVAVPFSRRSSQPRDWTQVSHIAADKFSISWATKEAQLTKGAHEHLNIKKLKNPWVWTKLSICWESERRKGTQVWLLNTWPTYLFNKYLVLVLYCETATKIKKKNYPFASN